MTARSFIKFIDIYGEAVTLKIKGRSTYPTVLGGLLTIATALLLIAATWTNGSDIFYREQPTLNLEERLLLTRPELTLDRNNFPFAIAMQDYSNNAIYRPDYFDYQLIKHQSFNSNNTSENTYYTLRPCEVEDFPVLHPDKVVAAGMLNYLCTDNQNLTISGFWDESQITYLIIRLSFCDNKTNPNCKPKEEAIEFLKTKVFTWNIYAQNSIINSQNYNDPISYFILNIYKNIKTDVSKMYNVFLKVSEIKTDDGIMFETNNLQRTISYDYSDLDDMDLGESLFDINIFVANRMQIYHRKYIKVQSVLANVGGLAKAIMMAAYFLTFYFSRVKKEKKILNKIFNFDHTDERNLKKKITESMIMLNNPTEKQMITNLAHSNYQVLTTDAVNSLNKKKQTEKNQILIHKKISFNYWEIISIILCSHCLRKRLRNKYEMFQLAKVDLDQYSDISVIIKKLDEYEKFKMVTLNNEQMALFYFISKTMCSLQHAETLKYEINRSKLLSRDEEKLFNILLDYKTKLRTNRNMLSEVDKRLIRLLDEELKIKLEL